MVVVGPYWEERNGCKRSPRWELHKRWGLEWWVSKLRGAGKIAMVLVDGEAGNIVIGSWAWVGVGNWRRWERGHFDNGVRLTKGKWRRMHTRLARLRAGEKLLWH